jgi:predicted ATPase
MLLKSVEEFQGLKLTTDVALSDSITAIVGRNGSGKTRLLKGIEAGKIQVIANDEQGVIRDFSYLNLENIRPNLIFGFNVAQNEEEIRHAFSFYNRARGSFHINSQQSIEVTSPLGYQGANIHQVAKVARTAALALGTDINSLTYHDIADYFLVAQAISMGQVNVTEIMVSYMRRKELNEYHHFKNERKGTALPHYSSPEFEMRFGSPPWLAFNEFLEIVLDGRYSISVPRDENDLLYEPKLLREDGREMNQSWLSSGEKILMWLCLMMCASSLRRSIVVPKLLLFDELDGALHPQMVQKMHKALRDIVDRFGTRIIFTTHSPTTIALFESDEIYQISEQSLEKIDKDIAIGELLVGVDQVSIHYTNKRQVYVESHHDAKLYGELFGSLKRSNSLGADYISLSFIPAAAKLAPGSVRQLVLSKFGEMDNEKVESFVQELNGQGNSAQVKGAVECLFNEGSQTVHGIIDWDHQNKETERIHVLGIKQFYSIENAILNPLTIGFYLFKNYHSEIVVNNLGLADDFDLTKLYDDSCDWQMIADSVTKRVLNLSEIAPKVECAFVRGRTVIFDEQYVYMNGHDLEGRLKLTFKFLNAHNKGSALMMDVVNREMKSSHCRSMPKAFLEIFRAIQSAR